MALAAGVAGALVVLAPVAGAAAAEPGAVAGGGHISADVGTRGTAAAVGRSPTPLAPTRPGVALAPSARPGTREMAGGRVQTGTALHSSDRLVRSSLAPVASRGKGKGKATTASVPELDARSSGAALALLAGGVLVLVDGRRRRRARAAAGG